MIAAAAPPSERAGFRTLRRSRRSGKSTVAGLGPEPIAIAIAIAFSSWNGRAPRACRRDRALLRPPGRAASSRCASRSCGPRSLARGAGATDRMVRDGHLFGRPPPAASLRKEDFAAGPVHRALHRLSASLACRTPVRRQRVASSPGSASATPGRRRLSAQSGSAGPVSRGLRQVPPVPVAAESARAALEPLRGRLRVRWIGPETCPRSSCRSSGMGRAAARPMLLRPWLAAGRGLGCARTHQARWKSVKKTMRSIDYAKYSISINVSRRDEID